MTDKDARFEALREADVRNQAGYFRYLCELYLRDHPDHCPTLICHARNLISLGQYAAAQLALDRAQTIVPEKRLQLVLAQRGHLAEARGDFLGAETWFMQAHKLDPGDATYLVFAGSVSFRNGDIDRAEAHMRKATECTIGCIEEAFFNLGGYLLSTRRYRGAADCYVKALEIDPEYGLAKERLSDVQLILDDEAERLS